MKIQVKTNSKKQTLTLDPESPFLLIHLKSSPEKSKANNELIKFLAKLFGKTSLEVVITQGFTSRDKIVFIKNTSLKLVSDRIKKIDNEK